MNKFMTIGRKSGIAFAMLMIVALPLASVQAADLSGYSYDYFVPDMSYSYDYFVPDYGYSYDYYVPDYSYSYDYYVPDYDYGYSYDYYVPNYNDSYSYDYYVADSYSGSSASSYASAYASAYASSYSSGGGYSYSPPSSGCKKNCNPPKPKPQPVCALDISPSRVDYGDDATIHWTSENATSATLTGFGSVSTGGSRTINNITSSKTYTLTVKGPGGTATCHDTVEVEKERDNLECKLRVSDSRIKRGDSVRVTWSSKGADYGYITPDIGNVDEDGSETVRPRSTTTYKGTFYGKHGDKITCSTKVTVDEYPVYIPPHTPYVTLSAVPYTGFELGPVGTAVYWSLLVLWCLIAAYLIAVKKAHVAIARRLNNFLFGSHEQVVSVAPTATVVHKTATSHSAHAVHSDATDEFVLSQLARGRHAH